MWEQESNSITITAPYQTARILVLAEDPDLGGLNPAEKLYDGNGMWVLQFATPPEARAAIGVLTARGITAEPDYFVTVAKPDAAE